MYWINAPALFQISIFSISLRVSDFQYVCRWFLVYIVLHPWNNTSIFDKWRQSLTFLILLRHVDFKYDFLQCLGPLVFAFRWSTDKGFLKCQRRFRGGLDTGKVIVWVSSGNWTVRILFFTKVLECAICMISQQTYRNQNCNTETTFRHNNYVFNT